ncbi:hypothetical protein [Streptomyces sp. NPDC008150]|uniref:hypothetical protein n=1 Tax=Streptomyces sp. NPDC008150 TaxID=3364816 RepID=UPI0036E07640
MTPDRYHLTLIVDGREVQHGWWGSEATARGKFARWVGRHSDQKGARILLVDTATGDEIAVWPDDAGDRVSD